MALNSRREVWVGCLEIAVVFEEFATAHFSFARLERKVE
jgi:hypothetical protein